MKKLSFAVLYEGNKMDLIHLAPEGLDRLKLSTFGWRPHIENFALVPIGEWVEGDFKKVAYEQLYVPATGECWSLILNQKGRELLKKNRVSKTFFFEEFLSAEKKLRTYGKTFDWVVYDFEDEDGDIFFLLIVSGVPASATEREVREKVDSCLDLRALDYHLFRLDYEPEMRLWKCWAAVVFGNSEFVRPFILKWKEEEKDV